MKEYSASDKGIRYLSIATMIVILLYGVNQAQAVVVLFIASMFLAAIGRVPVLWMERHHVPTAVAALTVIVLLIVFLIGIGVVVGVSLNNFSESIPFYRTRAEHMLLAAKGALASKGITVTDEVLLGYVDTGALVNFASSLFTTLSSLLSSTFLILFTVLFILLEASGFPAKIRRIQHDPASSFERITGFVSDIKRYMAVKMLINLTASILIIAWLEIIGVDFPFLWGFMAFLLLFIPSIGSVIAAVPAIVLALIQLGPGAAALTALGYFAVGTLVGNIIEPKVMGKKFGMSTLVVFLSLIIWGNLLGIVGALLCVPLTMSVKLACEMNEGTKWIAVLLGPDISVNTRQEKRNTKS
jgi:predicted PurR-regulated permease PerM